MKLYLVFVVLFLAPLVMADLTPNGPKVLYDSDYVIVEGLDTYKTIYDYTGIELIFQFVRNPSTQRDHPDWLVLRGHDLKAQNLSFAIDTYFYDQEAMKTDLCRAKSNPDLKKIVYYSSNRTAIRQLTHHEEEQLQKFKEEHKETKNPLKVTYNGTQQQFHTQTVGQSKFTANFGHENRGNLVVQVIATDHSGIFRYMDLMNEAKNTSFAIEGNTPSRDRSCYDTGSEDLRSTSCIGPISARPN